MSTCNNLSHAHYILHQYVENWKSLTPLELVKVGPQVKQLYLVISIQNLSFKSYMNPFSSLLVSFFVQEIQPFIVLVTQMVKRSVSLLYQLLYQLFIYDIFIYMIYLFIQTFYTAGEMSAFGFFWLAKRPLAKLLLADLL